VSNSRFRFFELDDNPNLRPFKHPENGKVRSLSSQEILEQYGVVKLDKPSFYHQGVPVNLGHRRWGARIVTQRPVEVGQHVEVTSKNGKTWMKKIHRVIFQGLRDGVMIALVQ